METIEGDLIQLALAGKFDVIIHGCNCFHTMGAGIAKTIKQTFPEAYEADLQTPKGVMSKLGQISCAPVIRGDSHSQLSLTIVNGYTQFDYHGSGVKADYEAIRSVMRLVKQQFTGKRIGYPQIGAGLARGDWPAIEGIINEELSGENHTLVVFKPSVQSHVTGGTPRRSWHRHSG